MSLQQVIKPQDPVLFDLVIGEMQDILASELSWLTHAFGKSQKLVKHREKNQYVYPGIHVGKNQYIDMFPTTEYGNYCFFSLEEPQTVEFNKNRFNTLKATACLIFWMDLSKISNSQDRRLENVKQEILTVLTRKMFIKSGRFTFNRIYEEAKEIYNGYSIQEIENQFLMQPYCGLKFTGELIIKENFIC